MKKLATLIITLFALGYQTITAQEEKGIQFIHDGNFQEILDMARSQNKLIFMDCYTSWCGPCKRLSAMVFPDSAVGEYYNSKFINCKFDMEKGEGITLSSRYAIRAYPTLLWIDADGNVKHKIVGGVDAPTLIANGKKATDPTPGILAGMRKQFDGGNRDVDFLSDYLNTLQSADEGYQDIFKMYLDKLSPKEMTDAKHTKTIFNLTNDLKSPGLPYLMKNKGYYSGMMGATAFNTKINAIATKAVNEAPKADDSNLYTGAMDLLKANKAADYKEKTLQLSMAYYLRMNDWVNYDKNASAYIKKYAPKNAAILNDVSWNYYININNEAMLQKALKWSYQAILIDNKYTNNLTYAYLNYKLNNYKEAEKACDYAIIQAKAENVEPTSATFLKDAINKTLNEKQ